MARGLAGLLLPFIRCQPSVVVKLLAFIAELHAHAKRACAEPHS